LGAQISGVEGKGALVGLLVNVHPNITRVAVTATEEPASLEENGELQQQGYVVPSAAKLAFQQAVAEVLEAAAAREAVAQDEVAPPDETVEISEDHIIYGLAKLLKHMARATKPSADKSCFQSVRLPKVSLSSYASRIHKYFRCTDECFVLCLVYIDRILKWNPDIQVTDLTCHRLLLTGAMVAAKFHDDEYASNEYFARVGGIDTQELNSLEAEFLQRIKWKLYVGPTEYDWFLRTLREIP